MSKSTIDFLEWDSGFFELNVGKIEGITNETLKSIDTDTLGEKENYDLIYLFSLKKLDLPEKIFEDCKVLLHIDVSPCKTYTIPPNIEKYNSNCSLVLEDLKYLALQAGKYSRFKRDVRFDSQKFEYLYEKWLINSLNCSFADVVYLYKDQKEILGFITITQKKEFCEIGLLAVKEGQRGKGIGRQLLSTAMVYTSKVKKSELRVPTQEVNSLAIKFYTSFGFKIFNKTYIYHYWKQNHDTI